MKYVLLSKTVYMLSNEKYATLLRDWAAGKSVNLNDYGVQFNEIDLDFTSLKPEEARKLYATLFIN